MKEEISQNNVLEMAELIAFMELRFQIGYQGSRMQKMYADLYGDIKHKNELGYMLSDSYDLVQEGALFLCEHYGKHLSDVLFFSMINPFFRLYHNQRAVFMGNDSKQVLLEKPDIWPAIIQNRELFDMPENEYIISPMCQTQDDRFTYLPKALNEEDIVYINTLLLSQAREIIGFNDACKIIDSIYYFVWHQGNYQSVKTLSDTTEEVLFRLVETVVNSPFQQLCKYCDSRGGINKTEFLFLFEKLTSNIYKDFYSNPYLNEYYIERPEETIKCHALDFLGMGEKRLDVFRKNLENIKNKTGDGK